MKFHTCAVLISMALLINLTACKTTSDAEVDTQTQQQAQTQQYQEGNEAGAQQMANKQEMMKTMCPMQVEGTTRELVKLDDAVAMLHSLSDRVQNDLSATLSATPQPVLAVDQVEAMLDRRHA